MLPVVFDLDGTLIDSLPTMTGAANALLSDLDEPVLTPDVVAGFVGWGEQVFLDKMIASAGLQRFDRADLMRQFLRHYKSMGHDVRLMAGAETAMRALKAEGAPLALCTNKPRVALEPVLEACVLGGLLDIVMAGDDLERRKPDPMPLLHILAEMGMKTGLYVGDNHIDAETAERAGVPFALFTEGIRTKPVAEIPHDFAFSNFSDLPQIWRNLRG
jgi:phosphoglycolate phosphatase